MQLISMLPTHSSLLQTWLDKERLYRWFGDAEYWLSEYEHETNHFFIALEEQVEIGFCRYTTNIPEEFQQGLQIITKEINELFSYDGIMQNACAHLVNNHGDEQSTLKPMDFRGMNTGQGLTVFSIDYAIGLDEYLGKGHGKKIIECLSDMLKACAPCLLVASCSQKNVPSCRALLANGFVLESRTKLFIKFIG